MREALSYISKKKISNPIMREDEDLINITLDFKEIE